MFKQVFLKNHALSIKLIYLSIDRSIDQYRYILKPCPNKKPDAQTKFYLRFMYKTVFSVSKSYITVEYSYKECFCTWPNPWDPLPRYTDTALGRAAKTMMLKYSALELPSPSVVPTLLCNSCLLMIWSEKCALDPFWPAQFMLPFPKKSERQRKCCKPSSRNSSMFLDPTAWRQFRQLFHLRLLLSSTEGSLLEVLLCNVKLKHWFPQRDFLDPLAGTLLHLNCIRKVLFPGNKMVFEIIPFPS